MKHINIDIRIQVENLIEKVSIYMKNFIMYVREDFVVDSMEKKHNLESHLHWFQKKIKINQQKEVLQQKIKWTLYYVDYGINIGSEINGTRPSIIFKANEYSYGSDLIVIPMTSFDLDKSIDTFDIIIDVDAINKLKRKSIIKTRQIRVISQKRLGAYIGKIENIQIQDQLNKNIQIMLWIQDIKNPSE